jgi:hypothetical protein
MAFEQKEGRGSLFKNKRERTEKSPDYKGDMKIDGKLYWLNGWIQTDKNGDKYMSLSLQPKEQKQEQQKYKVVGGSDVEKPDPNDEISF